MGEFVSDIEALLLYDTNDISVRRRASWECRATGGIKSWKKVLFDVVAASMSMELGKGGCTRCI